MKKTLLMLPVLFFITACSPKQQSHGYLPRDSQIAEFQLGVTNKAAVVQAIGTPGFINDFSDNRWNYVAFRTEQIGFEKPDIVAYDVLQLIFDDSHILQKVNRGNKDDLVQLSHDPDFTPSAGREMGLIEQLMGNIGKFN